MGFKKKKPYKVDVDFDMKKCPEDDKDKPCKLEIEVEVEVDIKDHSHKHKDKDKCKEKHECDCKNDCLCKLLQKFEGQEVSIKTKSGDFIEGVLKEVKDCCVKIIEPGMLSPKVNERLTVIRCKDIESFTVELLTDK
ncbi:hypothetical protein [Robertmurraya sp. P23]|uniref:hypothetical protein n=1 Tax=Robertmurraya sp. P23 TaxID=3436931 RepID=UPI003D994DD0